MGYRVNFMDNSAVTAEFLNETAAELGGGVLAFENQACYGVDALNDISAALITGGVSRGCELCVAEDTVTIGEGVLYFADGHRVTIDADGITLALTPETTNYVWFDYDKVNGFASPRCMAEMPESETAVLLGSVSPEGDILAKPWLACMKNPYLGLHFSESVSKTFSWDYKAEETLLWEIELQDVGFRYAIVHSDGYLRSETTHNAFCGFVDLQSLAAFSVLDAYMHLEKGTDAYPYSSDNGEILVASSMNTNKADTFGYGYYFFVYLRFEIGADKVLRVYQRAENSKHLGSGETRATEITITLC